MQIFDAIPDSLLEDIEPYILMTNTDPMTRDSFYEFVERNLFNINAVAGAAVNFNHKHQNTFIKEFQEDEETGIVTLFENRFRSWQLIISLDPGFEAEGGGEKQNMGRLVKRIEGNAANYLEISSDSEGLIVRFVMAGDVINRKPNMVFHDIGEGVIALPKESDAVHSLYDHVHGIVLDKGVSHPRQLEEQDLTENFDEDVLNASNYLLTTGLKTHSDRKEYLLNRCHVNDQQELISTRSSLYYNAYYDKDDDIDKACVNLRTVVFHRIKKGYAVSQCSTITTLATVTLEKDRPVLLRSIYTKPVFSFAAYLQLP